MNVVKGIRMSEENWAELSRIASALGITRNEYIVAILEGAIKRWSNTKS